MESKVKKLSLQERTKFRKFKGHTKIILKSVINGSEKIIEHDNDFQAGVLEKIMRNFGAYCSIPFNNSNFRNYPVWRNLCGGILLFQEEIDNSQDEVPFMPAGNTMIANGSFGVTNVATPVEMGTYNTLESQTDGNTSITMVWDWGTSQGNGTIRCVCLTSEIGGYTGYGNPSGVTKDKTDFLGRQSSVGYTGVPYKNNLWEFGIDYDNEEVIVTRKPIAITQSTIFDGIAKNPARYSYSGYDIDHYTSQYSVGITPVYIAEGDVALLPFRYTGSISNGVTYNFLIYNIDTHAIRQGKIINTTGSSIVNGSFVRGYLTMDDEGYIYGAKYGGSALYGQPPVYKFDSTTGALEATLLQNVSANWSQTDIMRMGQISEGLFLCHDYMIDSVNGTEYPVNCSTPQLIRINDHLDTLTTEEGIYHNPLHLSTINNLDEAVIKDATMTMKVIYTLTEVAE